MSLGSTDIPTIVSATASLLTAVGVAVAVRQLTLSKRLATMAFEDQLSMQYRSIVHALPIGALLNEQLSDAEYAQALPTFYRYIDFSNEQAFLHRCGRVMPLTWASWKEGIEQNLSLHAFRRAWGEIAARAPQSFDDLRLIVPPPAVPRHLDGLQ